LDEQEAQIPASKQDTFVLAEYAALREEILQNGKTQFEIVAVTLLIAGTFLTFGMQTSIAFSEAALFVYPPLAALLCAAWSFIDVDTGLVGEYIHDHIERDGMQWEHHLRKLSEQGRIATIRQMRLRTFAVRGIFLGSQVLAAGLALIRIDFPNYSWEQSLMVVLLGLIDIWAIWFTWKAPWRRM
jgi:hypothetical protein